MDKREINTDTHLLEDLGEMLWRMQDMPTETQQEYQAIQDVEAAKRVETELQVLGWLKAQSINKESF